MTRSTLFSRSHPISLLIKKRRSADAQGRSEGTSSVAFEVLIIKSEIDFINLFIFNCLMSNVNFFIFNCLTSNINLFNFSFEALGSDHFGRFGTKICGKQVIL